MPQGLEELNPEHFNYENWSANWWNDLGLDYEQACDDAFIIKVISDYGIGYCDSSRMNVRPQEKFYAVMFEKDGYRFWCHIHKCTFDNE